MYHESARPTSVKFAISATCATQASCASGVGSMLCSPERSRWAIASAIQSTCCSMDTTMLLNTDGLPGPVTRKRFGNPARPIPRYVRGPCAHRSRRATPSRPRTSIAFSAPVIASKPVAKTIASTS
jgi:hypothetical protein